MDKAPVQFHRRFEEYLATASKKDRAKIYACIEMIRSGDYSKVIIKTLRGAVRELKVKFHRLLFFSHTGTIYFVSGFRKKSAKTPKNELDYVEDAYKEIKENT